MLDKFKAGQNVRLTVVKAPRAQGCVTTIERLLRLDPIVQRGLRKARSKRKQTQFWFNRGNRDWLKRQTCGKIVKCAAGSTATFPYAVNLAPDIQSVAKYLKIEAA